MDVGNFSGDCFRTAYATELGRRVSIYGRKLINGSIERIGVPALLVVLELFGMKISWFLIRVEETVVATKVGLPQLALDLVSIAWMADLMNSGYNFCVGIQYSRSSPFHTD